LSALHQHQGVLPCIIEVVIVDDPIWRSLAWLTEKAVKSRVESERYPHVLHYYPASSDNTFQSGLGFENSYVPYCFLVKDGLIRWKASGQPTQDELEGLMPLFQQLSHSQSSMK